MQEQIYTPSVFTGGKDNEFPALDLFGMADRATAYTLHGEECMAYRAAGEPCPSLALKRGDTVFTIWTNEDEAASDEVVAVESAGAVRFLPFYEAQVVGYDRMIGVVVAVADGATGKVRPA